MIAVRVKGIWPSCYNITNMGSVQMKSKNNIKKLHIVKLKKVLDQYWAVIILLSGFFVATIIGLIVFTQIQTRENEGSKIQYKRHYMFVNQTGNSFISDRIYEDAKTYGKQKGVYVEQLGNYAQAEYALVDYLKMAMAMKVDGIILEGADEDDVRMAVNQASEQGIPVVTILSDCTGSRRKSFIELGDYDLGREYGRQIINITEKREPKVVLLINETAKGNAGEIRTGIQETLENEGNHLQVSFRTERLGEGTQSEISDKIKEILLDEEERPDILLCMDEQDTKTVYQFLIDYDLEGKVQIIGSCVSESLIKADRDGGIAALIDVDTEQAGMLCVDALNYYIENESVNDYIIVDDMVITKENVERYIEDE